MAQQDQIKAAQQRVAEQWDVVEGKSKSNLKPRSKSSGGSVLTLVGMVGAFILIASILFGGSPDVVDAWIQSMQCK